MNSLHIKCTISDVSQGILALRQIIPMVVSLASVMVTHQYVQTPQDISQEPSHQILKLVSLETRYWFLQTLIR